MDHKPPRDGNKGRRPFPELKSGLRRYPLHVYISLLFSLLIIIAGTILGWHNYLQNTRLILETADKLFAQLGAEMRMKEEVNYASLKELVSAMSYQQINQTVTLAERLNFMPYLREELRSHPSISSLYFGYDDGSFFLVRPLRAAAMRSKFAAPPGAEYLVQSVERIPGKAARKLYLFFDAALKEIGRVPRADYTYDPRHRHWYRQAVQAGRLVYTDPYVFFTTREIGVTFSRRSANGHSVVAVDATLEEVSKLLLSRRITPSSRMVWFDGQERVMALDQPELLIKQAVDNGRGELLLPKAGELGVPIFGLIMSEYHRRRTDFSTLIADGEREWKVEVIKTRLVDQDDRILAIAAPMDELQAEAAGIRRQGALITFAIVLLVIPVIWMVSRMISHPLRQLAGEARQIRSFRFSASGPEIKSVVWEIHNLAQAIYLMQAAIRKFLDISAALAAEHNFDRLLARVLSETGSAATADGGCIYLREDDDITLTPASQYFSTPPATTVALPALRLDHTEADHPLGDAARTGQTRVAMIIRNQPGADWIEPLLAGIGAPAATLVAVPLHDRRQELIGLLCLLKSASPAATAEEGIKPELVSFIEALSGVSAIAIDNQRLLKAQHDLMESLIKLIAAAIDAKSPYTGGHCQRVPELTRMLALAACEAQEGALSDYHLSDEEWEELHIASWLHDCGKVTTPEYVVDKATKLETIYNRLHEIRMRFEVLKRDAEIDYWRRLAGGEPDAVLREELARRRRTLDEEFAFVARCNEGGEFMAPEKIARLQRIASRTWMRTLDDRIGLSYEELARKSLTPAPALPACEPLLADKAEHIIPRPAGKQTGPDNRWGFKLTVPPDIQNRGEIHNLGISRGTLTAEERYLINEHIVQTIIMLSQLPFPKHLKHLPDIAGSHHEKIDGSGYPKHLRQDEMSRSAQILAIADIFEALTAADRPYKRGKTLSEALRIMATMRNEGHVSPELFALFLRSEVYLHYARRFLQPEQIDAVNIADYLS